MCELNSNCDSKFGHQSPKKANFQECNQEIIQSNIERLAIQSLEYAQYNRIIFSIISNFDYDASWDIDSPFHGHILSFKANEFLHITEVCEFFTRYNKDWFIGRIVKEGSGFGFIPASTKFENSKQQQSNIERNRKQNEPQYFFLFKNFITQKILSFFRKPKDIRPYDIVPTMRPIVFVGPSIKGYDVTDLIQKEVFDSLKLRLEGRIIITRITAALEIADRSMCRDGRDIKVPLTKYDHALAEAKLENIRIFKLSDKMKLLFLDCDTINHPNQLAKTQLAPIFVYIKISSPKVFKELIKERGYSQIRHMKTQMRAFHKLKKCPKEKFDFVFEYEQGEIAYDNFVSFLEQYWRDTHYPTCIWSPEEVLERAMPKVDPLPNYSTFFTPIQDKINTA